MVVIQTASLYITAHSNTYTIGSSFYIQNTNDRSQKTTACGAAILETRMYYSKEISYKVPLKMFTFL